MSQNLYAGRRKHAERRAYRIAHDLCVDCGKEPHEKDRRRCAKCARKQSLRALATAKRLKGPRLALKQCVECGNLAMPGKRICGRCSELQTNHKATLRAKYKKEGRCSRCGHERDREDRLMCADCRKWNKTRDHKRGSAVIRMAEPSNPTTMRVAG